MTTNTNNTNTATVTPGSATPLSELVEAREQRDAERRREALAAAFTWTERVGVRLGTEHFLECLHDRPSLSGADRAALIAHRGELLAAGLELAA